MATRKYTMTIPESLGQRLDSFLADNPGKLKVSAFFQEKLAEFLDNESKKVMDTIEEQQALGERLYKLMLDGIYLMASGLGRGAGMAWAKTLTDKELIDAYSKCNLDPFPLILNRDGLIPKALVEGDRRVAEYFKAMIGEQVLEQLINVPGTGFPLSTEKKQELLSYINGWNMGLEEVYSKFVESPRFDSIMERDLSFLEVRDEDGFPIQEPSSLVNKGEGK